MGEHLGIASGVRVRCLARGFKAGEGPGYGWHGTVLTVDHGEDFLVVSIAWDELRGNRAERRHGDAPVHVWGFDGVEVAAEFLEVLPPN